MKFQYVIYKQTELEVNGRMADEIWQLLVRIRRYGINSIPIETGSVSEFFTKHQIAPEDTLLIAATDQTLEEICGQPVASIGFDNPDLINEGLYQADILVEGFAEVDYYFLERIYQRKHQIPWHMIDTKRCYLREMTEEDLPDLYKLYEGEGITKYVEPLYEWEEELAYTKAYIKNMYRYYGYGMWLVKDRDTHELIGRAGLNNLEFGGKWILEMGYIIAADRQRMGYATEVCKAIIEYAKGADTGYDRLYCFVQPENEASKALLKHLQFVSEGYVWRDKKEMEVYSYLLISK